MFFVPSYLMDGMSYHRLLQWSWAAVCMACGGRERQEVRWCLTWHWVAGGLIAAASAVSAFYVMNPKWKLHPLGRVEMKQAESGPLYSKQVVS